MAESNRSQIASHVPSTSLHTLQQQHINNNTNMNNNSSGSDSNTNKRQLAKQSSDQKSKRQNTNSNTSNNRKNSKNVINNTTANNNVSSNIRNSNNINIGNNNNIISSINNNSTRKKIQFPRSSFFIGSSSIYDSILIDNMPLDSIQQIQLSQTLSLRKIDDNSRFLLREDYTDDSPIRILKELEAIETIVKPYGPTLVNMYFKFVHPFYPILHKKVFLEKYDRSYKEVSSPLLSSVYLLALELWDNEPSLIDKPKPNAKILYQVARNCFADVLQRPKLTAVQAGLLLLQTNQGDERKWILCSQVVSLIEELGLGVDCEDWKLPKWEKGLRKRLAWAAFFQDKWISLIESRPSHLIPGVNWLVNELTIDDFTEIANTNELEAGRIFFMELINLSKILSQILNCFYTLCNTNLSMSNILQDAKPIQMKLRAWYQSLPDSDRALSSNTSRAPNSNPFLQLAYFIAEITLHRKIISTLHKNRDKVPFELITVCRNAAKSRSAAAIDFLMQLKSENIHNSFWYATSSADIVLIGVFSIILFLTSWSIEEKRYYKDQIFNYRLCLKIISKNFYHAWKALRVFDLLYLQIKELQINDDDNANENNNTNDNTNGKSTVPYMNPVMKNNNANNNVNNNSNNEGSPYSPSNIPIHSNMHAPSPFIPFHPSNASSPTTPYNSSTFTQQQQQHQPSQQQQSQQQQSRSQQQQQQQQQHNINSPGSFLPNGSSSFIPMQSHGPPHHSHMTHHGLPPGVVSPAGPQMMVSHSHVDSPHSGMVPGMALPGVRPIPPRVSHGHPHPQMMMQQPPGAAALQMANGSGNTSTPTSGTGSTPVGPVSGKSTTPGAMHGFMPQMIENNNSSLANNDKLSPAPQVQGSHARVPNGGVQQGITPFDDVSFVDQHLFMLGMNFNGTGNNNNSNSNNNANNSTTNNNSGNNIDLNGLTNDRSLIGNMNNNDMHNKNNGGKKNNDITDTKSSEQSKS